MRRTTIACVLLFLSASGFAQSPEPIVLEQVGSGSPPQGGTPTIRLLAYAPRDDGVVLVKFSGVFQLAVEVDGDRGLEVEPPPSWTASAGWKIKDVEGPIVKSHGDGLRWRQTFILDPLTPMAASFELKPLRYRLGTGPWTTVSWKPVEVKILTQISGGDLKNQNPRENPAIEDLPLPTASFIAWEWPVAVGSGFVLIMIAMLWWRLRSARRSRNKSLEEIALYELTRLEALALPEKKKVNEFHTLLANVVRRYLEKRYQLPARRTTTPEFASLLDETPLLTADQKVFLTKFLHQCDLAKFAEARVSAQQCAELCRQTRDFLNTTVRADKP